MHFLQMHVYLNNNQFQVLWTAKSAVDLVQSAHYPSMSTPDWSPPPSVSPMGQQDRDSSWDRAEPLDLRRPSKKIKTEPTD